MALIDIDTLLSAISDDEPCGPDLEYDPEHIALLQDAQGSPAKYTPDGQLVEEGEDPNWADIKKRCVEMFGRTIDLRIALTLTTALMCQHGMPGLRDGLELLKQLHERHWPSFHPQLDPEDDNDPLMRMNLIAALSAPIGADGDPYRFQQRLREIPLAESRQLGRFNMRDLMIAAGELPAPEGAAPPNEGLLDGAFKETDGEQLKATGQAAEEAQAISKELDQWITKEVGASNACNLQSWHTALGDLNARLRPRIEARFPGETVTDDAGGGAQAEAGGGGQPAAQPSISGAVNTRDDVLRVLNRVLEYYARSEPSSPVPLLIRRAQRMVNMEFVDIIRDLSPGALESVRAIGGEEALTGGSRPPAPPAPPPAAGSPPKAEAPPPAPPKSEQPTNLADQFR